MKRIHERERARGTNFAGCSVLAVLVPCLDLFGLAAVTTERRSDWLNTFDIRINLGPGPSMLAGVVALGIAIGTVAGHALRLACLDPVHALRYE